MKRALLLPVIVLGLSCSSHASHRPGYHRATNVTRVAYELERTTWSLQRDAQYSLPHRDRHARRLLKELNRLEKRAGNFRRTVERRHWEDRRSQKDFDKLVRQYQLTRETSRYSYAPRHVYRGLSRVGQLIGRLQPVYGRNYSRRW